MMKSSSAEGQYRGRLAPSPTGWLHVGHARTFSIAAGRAREHAGTLVVRNEDLDPQRCRPGFVGAMFEDLRWLGIAWAEGPDCGGPYAPYSQSERRSHYLKAWRKLRDGGYIYPCTCSRKDLERALSAPHEDTDANLSAHDDELPYPGTCRSKIDTAAHYDSPAGVSWRFKVPDGEALSFNDGYFGKQEFTAGRDF